MQNLTGVFLVEDDEDDRHFFIAALKHLCNVFLLDSAHNGQEALDKLRRASALPAVIFVDFNMPVMNGLAFLVEKSRDANLKDIPVVMLSGSTNMREEAFNSGANAFIDKQADETALRNELALALDNWAFGKHGSTKK